MKRILVYVPVLMILMVSQVMGQVSQTAVPFLLIAPGARAGGMGETFVSIADDATATHWNPAGLGRYPLSPDWLTLPVDLGKKIESITLVSNDMPEMNYKRYDVWAVIDGQLARWDEDHWTTGTEYDLDEGRSIKSILRGYTGLTDEELTPFYAKLAETYTDISSTYLDSLKNKISMKLPEDYLYADEIELGFENLKNAWSDFKLNQQGFEGFENMVNKSLADDEFSKSELDSIAFGFDNAISKRAVKKINIPYSLIITSEINDIVSHGGMLYIGTDDGFFRYDPKRNKWKSYSIEDGLPSMRITSLAQFRRRSILVGTDVGLVYFDGAKVKTFNEEQQPPTDYITSLSAVSDRNIWAASENDLYHYDGKGWHNYYEHTVSIGEDLDKIVDKFYGDIALLNRYKYLSDIKELNEIQEELNVNDKVRLPYKFAFKGSINSLSTMGNNLWIGTETGIILSVNNSFIHFGYKRYTASEDIEIRDLARQFVADKDTKKIDQLTDVILKYNDIEGTTLKKGETVLVYANALGAPIKSIAVASDKRAYVATAFGVVEYDNGMWSRFPRPELARAQVHTIKTESGELWFATDDRVFIKAKAMKQLTFMHSNYLVQLADDLYYEFFSFIFPTSEWGTFGVGVTFLSYGSQERRGEYGEDLGQFNSYDIALTLSYGTKLMDNMSAGLSAKYINSHLADVGAGREKGKGVGFSFALDGGLLYDVNDRLTLATTVTNIGPEISYIDADQADPLPRKLSLAFAYRLVNSTYNRLTFVGEASKLLVDLNDDLNTEVEEIIPHAGLEYWYSNYVSLRGGYIYDEVGQQKYFTTGASLQYNNLRFDFSYVPSSDEKYNRMGNTMRFSMNVVF